MTASELQALLEDYLEHFPGEHNGLALLSQQLADGDNMNNRKTLPGHITAGAFVLSPDRKRILLIYHRLFGIWLQPGGHWDPGEPDPWTAARREAIEETAVTIDRQLTVFAEDPQLPLNIISHDIPARPEKQESAHAHHDFEYVFIAADEVLTHQESEVAAAGWFAFDAPEARNVQLQLTKMHQAKLI